MKLIFLHGPPAVGKLTVARALGELAGWRVFHNHLAVDLALSVFEFGTPGFVALRESIWFSAIRAALDARLPALVFTFNPENSVPQRFIDELFAEVPQRGGRIVSVELTANDRTIEERIVAESRKEHRKLADLGLYRELRSRGVFQSPVIPRTDLKIDTGRFTPKAAATEIAVYVAREIL
jgi:hypothetical protein